MEDQQILDVTNELHMQVLHLVFLPRMQLCLDRFTETLKRRPLRTENNRSPLQLWVSGQPLDPEFNPHAEVNNVNMFPILYISYVINKQSEINAVILLHKKYMDM